MLKGATVFVIGAGVSHEFGLPLGSALKTRISNILPGPTGSGSDVVRDIITYRAGAPNDLRHVVALRAALEVGASIDNIVEHHADDKELVFCAKIGILASILDRERASPLYIGHSPNVAQTSHNSTLNQIFQLIVGSAPVNALGEAFSRVAFITFNYDRCLERYLAAALSAYSGISHAATKPILSRAKIWHPYGSIGDLSEVEFGQALEHAKLRERVANIRTFSEERGSLEDVEIKKAMASASQVIFLGCALHPQNMKLIRPEFASYSYAYGTCYVPPPPDPGGAAAPSITTFAGPTIAAFEREVQSWKVGASASDPKSVHFEALTSQQLVAKYRDQWIDT